MPTLSQIKANAARQKIAIQVNRDNHPGKHGYTRHEIILTAPDGFIFVDGVHEGVCSGETIGQAINEAIEYLTTGVEPCTDADCEWCEESN